MFRGWLKLLPFFVVEWLAALLCSIDWLYVQPFGPGTRGKPQANVLIEVDVSLRRSAKYADDGIRTS